MHKKTDVTKNLPRHSACSIELKGGASGIVNMCPCIGFVEIYKVDMTFQVQSPEDLDPEETDPNMSWVVKSMPGVGCGNEIVARLMVQSRTFVEILIHDEKKMNKIMHYMRQCKELLLICDAISKEVSCDVQKISKQIDRKEIHYDRRMREFNPFPQVNELEDKCIRFLTNSKNFLQSLAEVFNIFYDGNCHGPHFHKICEILNNKHGNDHAFFLWVKDNQATIKYIVDLRNAQEHPKDSLHLEIKNFSVANGNKITSPIWKLMGCREQHIDEEMKTITNYLLEFAELFLIFCAISSEKLGIPYVVVEIPEAQRNKECPVRYQPEIDRSKLLILNTPKE